MRVTTINSHPTFVYSQPDAYRFSHDSVFLARAVFDRVAGQVTEKYKVLDLCAGCGIVGLDFLFHCKEELGFTPATCDFIEVQDEYAKHFRENRRRLGEVKCELKFLAINYSALGAQAEKYDLVICNPPYFRVGQGKLSASKFKNRCRFFMDSDFSTLLKSIAYSLKPTGEAYVLLRELDDHGIDAFAEAQALINAHLEIVADIRGTNLLRIKLPNP